MISIPKTYSICLLALYLIVFTDTSAHEGHDHELTREQAILRATAIVSSLIDKEKKVAGEMLNVSWNEATNAATCKETPEHYLISISNRAVGKTLYVLLSSAGKYLRANFDGHFADLAFSPYPLQSC